MSNRPGLMSTVFGHSGDMPHLFTLFIEHGGCIFLLTFGFRIYGRSMLSIMAVYVNE